MSLSMGFKQSILSAEAAYQEDELNHDGKMYLDAVDRCVKGYVKAVKAGVLSELLILLVQLSDISSP
jgi:hypothetical protein